jgi:hypothetical protein
METATKTIEAMPGQNAPIDEMSYKLRQYEEVCLPYCENARILRRHISAATYREKYPEYLYFTSDEFREILIRNRLNTEPYIMYEGYIPDNCLEAVLSVNIDREDCDRPVKKESKIIFDVFEYSHKKEDTGVLLYECEELVNRQRQILYIAVPVDFSESKDKDSIVFHYVRNGVLVIASWKQQETRKDNTSHTDNSINNDKIRMARKIEAGAGDKKRLHEILPEYGRKRILTDVKIVEQIKSSLRCTHPTVYSALKYRTNTLLARRIREKALELGAMEIECDNNSENG